MMIECNDDGLIRHIMATGSSPEHVERRRSEGSHAFWKPEADVNAYATHFMDVETGELVFRPRIDPIISKMLVRGNGYDISLIKNLPTGAKVAVRTMGQLIGDIVVDADGEVELVFDHPGNFEITINGPKSYYIPANVVIEAI